MAFWSKLGKGLLKVGKVAAPIALGMTGVGLPAAMAVSGGLNALDKKVSGGSWKQALGAGAMGAGMAAGSAGLGKLGGWAGKFGKMGGKAAPAGGYAQTIPPDIIKQMSPETLASIGQNAGQSAGRAMAPRMGAFQRIMGNIGTGARTARDVAGAVGAMRGAMGGGGGYRTPPFNPNGGGIMGGAGAMRTQRGMAMPRMDQRAPNLAYAIQRGRNEAMMNQPWRTPPINPDPTQQLPPIYPNMGGGGIGPSYMPQY